MFPSPCLLYIALLHKLCNGEIYTECAFGSEICLEEYSIENYHSISVDRIGAASASSSSLSRSSMQGSS